MSTGRIDLVRVVNTNAFTIRDRHDGVPYVFVPGVAVDIPPDVAAHLFAFPADDEVMHAHMARRWGWNRPEHAVTGDDGLMLWQRLAKAVTIAVQHYELRQVTDIRAPIPADTAEEAPDMLAGIKDDPPPRRTAMGRARPAVKRRVKPPPRRPTPPSAPVMTAAEEPKSEA